MPTPSTALVARVRRLVDVFNQTDLVRLRMSDDQNNAIELRRAVRAPLNGSGHAASNGAATETAPKRNVDTIKSDLVGVAHLSRPAPAEGGLLDGDRELAYVEALGIRNPVRSLGGGRVVAVLVGDGEPVEYGQPLFEIERV